MSAGSSNAPDFIVIRRSPDLPSGFVIGEEGKWYDRSQLSADFGLGQAVAVPTGRFEVRADGAVAEVWEVRP